MEWKAFGSSNNFSGLFGAPLRRSSLFEEMEKTRFADTVAQKMGTGVAQGNGGYATGQSPEELFKKAQIGLIGSQTAENKAQTERFNALLGMVDPRSGQLVDGGGRSGLPGGIMFPKETPLGGVMSADPNVMQNRSPALAPQSGMGFGLSPYEAAEQARRWSTTNWQ